jgi:hypothetical protein
MSSMPVFLCSFHSDECKASILLCCENDCSLWANVFPHVCASVLDFGMIQGYGWDVIRFLFEAIGKETAVSSINIIYIKLIITKILNANTWKLTLLDWDVRQWIGT